MGSLLAFSYLTGKWNGMIHERPNFGNLVSGISDLRGILGFTFPAHQLWKEVDRQFFCHLETVSHLFSVGWKRYSGVTLLGIHSYL